MGSIEKDALNRAQELVSVESPFKVTSLPTDVVRTDIDPDLNITATLKSGSSPIISLDLLDDIEAITELSRHMVTAASSNQDGPRNFILKSEVPRIFALGGDLALFRYYIERQDAQSLKRYARKCVRAIWALLNGLHSNRLTISFVNGEAQGGGFEAALACHVFVSTRRASFGFPEALFGLFPGMGAAPLLTSRADSHAAKTLLSTSGRYPAEMLYEMGIIDYLIEEPELPDLLSELATKVRTNNSTKEFSLRFNRVRYEDLIDTVDEWTSQALRLESRKIDVMGVILKAQNRLLSQRQQPTITIASSPLSISDFHTQAISRSGRFGPIVITPNDDRKLDAKRALSFLKDNTTWLERNLTVNGALLLQGFPGSGIKWLKSVAASLNGSRQSTIWGRLSGREFVSPGISRLSSKGELPSFESGAFPFPPSRALVYRDMQPVEGGGLRLIDGRRLLSKIDDSIIDYFSEKTLIYSWHLSNERRRGSSGGVTWQSIFGTNERSVVATECFESGLFCEWENEDNSLRIWREATAISIHPVTGEHIWRNAIHDFCISEPLDSPTSIARNLTFKGGGELDPQILEQIANVIAQESIRIRWGAGDLIIVDPNQVGFSVDKSKGHEETYLMPI